MPAETVQIFLVSEYDLNDGEITALWLSWLMRFVLIIITHIGISICDTHGCIFAKLPMIATTIILFEMEIACLTYLLRVSNPIKLFCQPSCLRATAQLINLVMIAMLLISSGVTLYHLYRDEWSEVMLSHVIYSGVAVLTILYQIAGTMIE